MISMRSILGIQLALFLQSTVASEIYKKEIIALSQDLHIPATWRIRKNMASLGKDYPRTYCTEFYSRKSNQWLGRLCLSSNQNFISAMGVRDERPEDEDWADRSKYEVGYWIVTPTFIYPMTPFILDPIKTYEAEVDCSFDERGNRPTSTCHAAFYQLREGVFLHSIFHISDDVKRQRKAYVSDIRNLWIQVGKKIENKSAPK